MKPMTAPEILTRARNAFKMGEFTLVEKLAMRILEVQPESPVAYNLLGSVCEKTARFRKAIELFQKARKKGHAVGICHPFPETLAVLKSTFPLIDSYGLEAVPVSRLVR